jgi:hypothetical protein
MCGVIRVKADSLVLVMLIGLPVSVPMELKNSAKYAFGSFANRAMISHKLSWNALTEHFD